jgi:hypothetical protein
MTFIGSGEKGDGKSSFLLPFTVCGFFPRCGLLPKDEFRDEGYVNLIADKLRCHLKFRSGCDAFFEALLLYRKIDSLPELFMANFEAFLFGFSIFHSLDSRSARVQFIRKTKSSPSSPLHTHANMKATWWSFNSYQEIT